MAVSANGVPRVDIRQPVKHGLCQDAREPKGLTRDNEVGLRKRIPFALFAVCARNCSCPI